MMVIRTFLNSLLDDFPLVRIFLEQFVLHHQLDFVGIGHLFAICGGVFGLEADMTEALIGRVGKS